MKYESKRTKIEKLEQRNSKHGEQSRTWLGKIDDILLTLNLNAIQVDWSESRSLKCKKKSTDHHVTWEFSIEIRHRPPPSRGQTSITKVTYALTDSFIHSSSEILQKNMWKNFERLLGTVIKIKIFSYFNAHQQRTQFDRDELTFHCKSFSFEQFFISLLRFQICFFLFQLLFFLFHHLLKLFSNSDFPFFTLIKAQKTFFFFYVFTLTSFNAKISKKTISRSRKILRWVGDIKRERMCRNITNKNLLPSTTEFNGQLRKTEAICCGSFDLILFTASLNSLASCSLFNNLL